MHYVLLIIRYSNKWVLKNRPGILLSAIFLFCSFHYSNGQQGEFFTRNFSYKDYQAGISNWHVEQDARGIIYIANLNGLLEYDGVNWNLIQEPNGGFVPSIGISASNHIYLSSIIGAGYLKANNFGQLNFESLPTHFPMERLNIIVNIVPFNDYIYFISKTGILRWNIKNETFWSSKGGKICIPFMHNGLLTTYDSEEGIISFDDDTVFQIVKPEFSIKTGINLESSNKTLLFNDTEGKVYELNDLNNLSELTNFSINILNNQSLLFALALTNSNSPPTISISTRNDGVVQLDENGGFKANLNKNTGLEKSSLITNLSYDKENGLWITQLVGLSRMAFSPWKFWPNKLIDDGYVQDIIKFNKKYILASSKGGYFFTQDTIIPLPDSRRRMWSIAKSNNDLFMAGSTGILKIDNRHIEKVSEFSWATKIIELDSNNMLIGGGNGLIKMSKDQYKVETITEEIKGTYISLLKHNNSIWLNVKSKGVYQIENFNNNQIIHRYDTINGLPANVVNSIYRYKNNLLFLTQNGIYQLNHTPKADSTNLFIEFNEIIKERLDISQIIEDNKGNVWMIVYKNDKYEILKLKLNEDGSYTKITKPFRYLPEQIFGKIYPDPDQDGIIWISGTEGLYRFDDNFEKDYDIPFNTLVRNVTTGDSLIFGGAYFNPNDTSTVPSILLDQPDEFKPTLTYDYNQLTFEYAATSYDDPTRNMYSYWLEGNDKVWSAWSNETKKEYTNLSAGKYKFHVKSKNVYDTEGRIATYEFSILPPWYQKSWAYALFVVAGGFLIWLMILAYTYRIRVQRRKLKLIVADRTFEVLSQKKEIENQHRELLEKSEEIRQQSDVLSEKNAELESQQEEIMTINHQLNELNNHLEIEVENRTKKIKSTLTKLRKTNKELDTFIYRASHDLKSPISRIMGLTSLAKLEIPDDANREYFDLIEQASNDMKLLLDKLTQLHEVVNKEVKKEVIDLPSLLSKARESVKHLDAGKNTKYSFNIKDQLRLMSDEDIIQVIIENLIENALIFRRTEEKDHHIKIEVFKKDEHINVIVRDNGIGIEEEHQSQLFDMFFRASHQSKGSGLGLYLVKMAAEKLKGTIEVNSKPQEFSEFTVKFPA